MTDHRLTIERLYSAPIERVWAAWTDPALLDQWYCPNPELSLSTEVDLRVGGAWRGDMGDGAYVASGTYTRVEPPHHLEFTWRWEHDEDDTSIVTVTLSETGRGTLLVLTQSGFPNADEAAGHEEGWQLSLARLEALLG